MTPVRKMTKQTLQVVLEELLNKKRIELVEELFHPEFYNHDPAPGYSPDREGLKEFFTDLFQAFPNDFAVTCTHILGEGEKIAAARFLIEGIHEGTFMGVEGTHQKLNLPVISIVRGDNEDRDTRIIERWSVQDNLLAMQQLGLT